MKSWSWNMVLMVMLFLGGCSPIDENDEKLSEAMFSVEAENIKTFTPDHQLITSVTNQPYQRIVLLANTFYNYFEALNASDRIVGVFNLERMQNIPSNIQSVGEGANFDLEKIISLNPDLIICNSYQLEDLKAISTNKLAFDEYLQSDPVDRIQVLKMFAPIAKAYENVDSLIIAKQAGVKKAYENLNQSLLKLDNYGENWFKPGCETYISKICGIAGLDLECVKGSSQSEKVSFESAVLSLSKHELLLFMDWGEHKVGYKERLGEVIKLDKNSFKILYCNTNESGYFQASILNSGQIIKDLHEVVKTEQPGVFFEIIEVEK